ncbi:MAG: hypothetical protein RLZ10_2522 [Bacteroidota bacterium]|jgi:lipopolysaccharide transport system ATP-binding protein
MSAVIKVENLSKQYRLGQVGTGTLSHDINRWWHSVRGKEDPYLKIGESNDRTQKGESDYVWALKDINFEVEQGEVLGIIGRNGAGKSTLLKILSRTTAPTTGSVKIKGRVASLLEVGTGFHPELSGRDNIFLNGAILGMTRREIQSKFDEIVDFAGVERYIDTPVKRYSSGMYVRLAFAVAAHLEPEILIVDEVLAVGDAEFQKKCLGKMKDVSVNQGRTVLFVSHNMAAVSSLCTLGIVLNNGHIVFTGVTTDAVLFGSKNHDLSRLNYISNKEDFKNRIEEVKLIFHNPNLFVYRSQDIVPIQIKVIVNEGAAGMHIGLSIKNEYGQKIFTEVYKLTKGQLELQKVCVRMEIPAYTLLKGNYAIDAALFIPQVDTIEYISNACDFEVDDMGSAYSQFNGQDIGSVMIKCFWKEIE